MKLLGVAYLISYENSEVSDDKLIKLFWELISGEKLKKTRIIEKNLKFIG
jgi:hypothetical protein|tara:strand:- start:1300 stop:1449 length:150 start_codon:yes stop_codon:yes gene_type:complete